MPLDEDWLGVAFWSFEEVEMVDKLFSCVTESDLIVVMFDFSLV